MKTTTIQLREVLGAYDDKVKIYRDPSGTIVLYADTATMKMKDGYATFSGSLRIAGGNFGTPDNPSQFFLTPTLVRLNSALTILSNLIAGYSATPGNVYVLNAEGVTAISLSGITGDAKFLGGLNLGTATGAAAGQIKASGNAALGVPRILCPSPLWIRNAADDNFESAFCMNLFLKNNSICNQLAQLTILLDNDKNVMPPAELKPLGFLSTHGNELLATDIERHTITAQDFAAGDFTISWNKATIPKMVSLTASLNDAGTDFKNEAMSAMVASYNGSEIFCVDPGAQWSIGDIVTLCMLYEK